MPSRGAYHGRPAIEPASRAITTLFAPAIALCFAAWSIPIEALADPQANVGLVVGAAGRGQHARVFEEPAFHGGIHADVLFARDGNDDFGVGPYVDVVTQQFDEIQVGHGVSVLFPIIDTFPIVASVGTYLRASDDDYDIQPGIAGTLFFGSRSYDFEDSYVMAFGLVAQVRAGLDDRRQTSFILALHIDTLFLASPIVFIAEAIDGGSREVDPVTPTITAEAASTSEPTAPEPASGPAAR